MRLFLPFCRGLRRLFRPLLLTRLRPVFDPDWRVLVAGLVTRLEINGAAGLLLICEQDRAEIRPLADLRDATACGRRGRVELHLRLGDGVADIARIRCHSLSDAQHLAGLLRTARSGARRPDALAPHVWSAEAAIFSRLPGTY